MHFPNEKICLINLNFDLERMFTVGVCFVLVHYDMVNYGRKIERGLG